MSRDSFAYQAAIQRNIARNSRKGALRSGWREENADFLQKLDAEVSILEKKGKTDHFLVNMSNTIAYWGKLTPKQKAAAENALAKQEEFRAKNLERAQKEGEGKEWVGEVGKRYSFTLTIKTVKDLGFTKFAYNAPHQKKYMFQMEDRKGNAYVYFGTSKIGEEGETIKIKATIKSHNIYLGAIKQNILTRPHKLAS